MEDDVDESEARPAAEVLPRIKELQTKNCIRLTARTVA